MKIAAVVILYNPANDVVKNIHSYIGAIDKLYIIDNSPKPANEFKISFIDKEKVVWLHDGENKGIASRLNQVIKLAKEDEYDWLLTMDQDSFFDNETFDNYLNCVSKFDQKEKVSMFGINHSEKIATDDLCNSVSVNHLITSGSILNLKAASGIGGFDENLFIDEVDFEYCLRSISHGFQIIQFTNIFLVHHLGETVNRRSLKNIRLSSRVLHSPERLYYMARNFLYVESKYKSAFPAEIKERRRILLNRIKNNLLYNKERLKVLKFIIKGAGDYKKNCMGKLN
ncbi:MAG TPA: glycosyltransferase [Hanamia sp.]|nr:glycosyltransferase [Hanamia sp.]